jgi:transposase
MRARQVTLLRGLARAAGVLVASGSTDNFLQKLQQATLDQATRALMAPLVATLTVAQEQLAAVDKEIAANAPPAVRRAPRRRGERDVRAHPLADAPPSAMLRAPNWKR